MNGKPEKAGKVIILDPGDRVLVLQRSQRVTTRPGEADLPGGKEEKVDKEPRMIAIRETEEETGIVLEEEQMWALGYRAKYKNKRQKITYFFTALVAKPPAELRLSWEHTRGLWVPRGDIAESGLPEKYLRPILDNSGVFELMLAEYVQLQPVTEEPFAAAVFE